MPSVWPIFSLISTYRVSLGPGNGLGKGDTEREKMQPLLLTQGQREGQAPWPTRATTEESSPEAAGRRAHGNRCQAPTCILLVDLLYFISTKFDEVGTMITPIFCVRTLRLSEGS